MYFTVTTFAQMPWLLFMNTLFSSLVFWSIGLCALVFFVSWNAYCETLESTQTSPSNKYARLNSLILGPFLVVSIPTSCLVKYAREQIVTQDIPELGHLVASSGCPAENSRESNFHNKLNSQRCKIGSRIRESSASHTSSNGNLVESY